MHSIFFPALACAPWICTPSWLWAGSTSLKSRGFRVRTFAANDQHRGVCYWAKWKKPRSKPTKSLLGTCPTCQFPHPVIFFLFPQMKFRHSGEQECWKQRSTPDLICHTASRCCSRAPCWQSGSGAQIYDAQPHCWICWFFNCRVSLCWYLWLGAPPVGLELWTLPLTTAVRSLSSPGDDPQHKNWVILMQKSRFPLWTSLKSVVRS